MLRVSSVLMDTNVWLDYFLGAGPSLEAIKRLVVLGAEGSLTLLYAPTTAKDLFYLIPRRLRDATNPDTAFFRPAAWACIERMMELATSAPQSAAECELARMLRSSFSDFEDNLILTAAQTAKADYIVTQDRAFLQAYPEACITPGRALELLQFCM